MKILITLNILTAILFYAVMIAFQRFEGGTLLLLVTVLLPALGALAIGNLIAIFYLWGKHRFRAFLPALSYLLAVTLSIAGLHIGSRAVLWRSPSSPDTFFNEKTRHDLEEVAHSLLEHSIKSIRTHPGKPLEIEFTSQQKEQLSPKIEETLRTHKIQQTHIDAPLKLVVFSHYHLRTVHQYLYTTNNLLPPYSRPATFTENDFGDWTELLSIARQGPSATDDERKHIVFSPSIVYPYLQQKLGDDVLTQFRNYSSPTQIPPEYKALVLDALNQQRLPASRLIEEPSITFEDGMFPLYLGERKISDGFWVSSLIKQLLDRGVLLYTEDGQHLRIKSDLTPEESRYIEWVHVGLMDFLYGNLFYKPEYACTRSLGNDWYYNRW